MGLNSYKKSLPRHEFLTDRFIRDVNETANYVTHLKSMAKRLIGTSVYPSHLIFITDYFHPEQLVIIQT